jgi:hypothetical protein
MNSLKFIALNDLKTYGHWKSATLGALLQFRSHNSSEDAVGMRCEINIRGSLSQPCVLVLTGLERGKLLEPGALRDPAIDVTHLVEVRVNEMSLVPLSKELAELDGLVCEHKAGSGYFFARGRLKSMTRGYVWLRDPDGKTAVGTVETDVPPDLMVIGMIDAGDISRS